MNITPPGQPQKPADPIVPSFLSSAPSIERSPVLAAVGSLTPKQRRLHDALARKNEGLATMYLGAVRVLSQADNGERIAQSAHSWRELLEKMPFYLDAPIDSRPPDLGDQVNKLLAIWRRTQKSQCLDNLLQELGAFFSQHEQSRKTRRERTRKTLDGIDPLAGYLPDAIKNLRIREWDAYWDFFVNVSHHRRHPSDDEFRGWTESAEQFLMDRFFVRTFDDISKTEKIVGGDGNAKP